MQVSFDVKSRDAVTFATPFGFVDFLPALLIKNIFNLRIYPPIPHIILEEERGTQEASGLFCSPLFSGFFAEHDCAMGTVVSHQ